MELIESLRKPRGDSQPTTHKVELYFTRSCPDPTSTTATVPATAARATAARATAARAATTTTTSASTFFRNQFLGTALHYHWSSASTNQCRLKKTLLKS